MKSTHPKRQDVKLSEQKRLPKSRGYTMSKRADDVAATRRRIVEAAVRLHGTVGPAATTISALAEEAQVTRLTVYRHFPDDEALFAACSAHWASTQDLPDPVAWCRIDDPIGRLRAALADLYRFYRAGEPMLTNVQRDRAVLPEALREASAAAEARYRDLLLQPFSARASGRRLLRSMLAHALSFWTWRSLCVDNGLTDREAVELMVGAAQAVADR